MTEADTQTTRNLRKVAAALAVLPPDRWTSYGVIAETVSLHPRLVGSLMTDPSLSNAYQVLSKDGRISEGFRWSDPDRSEDPRALLESQGIAFDDHGRAARRQMLTADELRELMRQAGTLDNPEVPAQRLPDSSDVDRRPDARQPSVKPHDLTQDVAAFEQALAARTDLDRYRHNKRLLYAAELILDLADIHSVAAEALTDGRDDKSCDFIYVDRELGLLVLAQAYEAENPNKFVAEEKKVASLHQAVTWLFIQDPAKAPEPIRSAAREVHAALEADDIREVKIWFVHNLPESSNAARELNAVVLAAKNAVGKFSGGSIDVNCQEIGRDFLAQWYRTSKTPILVTDEMEVPAENWLSEEHVKWKSITVSVNATWLNQLSWRYGQELFSANVRGYLGHYSAKGNINQGIRKTLEEEPENFHVYNNGITALVDDIWEEKFGADGRQLMIRGLSIVNGAQTAGSLGQVRDEEKLRHTKVSMRLVKCTDAKMIDKIIRYNNRQNPTKPADFRSNDRVQTRLVQEFKRLGIDSYTGGRRGVETHGKTGQGRIEATTAAQALAAYHGMPGLAYLRANKIWEDDTVYSRLFNEVTTARHLVFCWTLRRAVEAYKQELLDRPIGDMPQGKKRQREFFDERGAILLTVTAIASCVEDLLDVKIPDSRTVHFKKDLALAEGQAVWMPVVRALAPYATTTLSEQLRQGLSLEFDSRSVLQSFQDQVASMLSTQDHENRFAEFRDRVKFG